MVFKKMSARFKITPTVVLANLNSLLNDNFLALGIVIGSYCQQINAF
jgi:hypothetical protein